MLMAERLTLFQLTIPSLPAVDEARFTLMVSATLGGCQPIRRLPAATARLALLLPGTALTELWSATQTVDTLTRWHGATRNWALPLTCLCRAR